MYYRINAADLEAVALLIKEIDILSFAEISEFNKRSNQMPWREGCTVRLYPNLTACEFDKEHYDKAMKRRKEHTAVDSLLLKLNSLNQETLGYLAYHTRNKSIGLAYTFVLPPPPPPSGP